VATLTYMPSDHVPALATELIELLDPHPGETAIDCTFGGGGHAVLVAERIGAAGTLIAIDRDPTAERRFAEIANGLERAWRASGARGQDSPRHGRMGDRGLEPEARFVRADFADALEELRNEGFVADMIYLDLGISSLQLDAAERGFSYSYDAPLDMRMDPDQGPSAADLVNEWPEERLAAVIRDYGEERHARSIAREIVRRRPMHTTAELVDAIRAAIPPAYRFGRGHPAKRTFQALRIAVNGELESLDRALPAAWEILRERGRLAVISFHSLEDRRVKRFLADRARGCICPPELPVCVCGREPEAEPLTRRALAATPEEVERNPRSHSARLRAARKLPRGLDTDDEGR
jgi:16S rRNA (cytosine1402-N4)-methyltransferase